MSGTETITLTRNPTKTTVGGADVPTVTSAPVTIPKDLGPVTLVRELGKGGMGVVYLGRHTMLNRDVAVKFLLNMVTSDNDPHFAMFLEGARAAAALQHKGLNAVLNADVVQGVPFIIMDFVDGPSLSHLLHRVHPFPLAAVRVVMEAACEAVAVLHEADVIHRDIKPANILLSRDGNPVLTDFGLACTRAVVLTGAKVEAVAGTPDYMAPEMFDRVVSPRSDVYALGVMFYEMLTGRLPYDGDFEQVRAAHREVEIPLDEVRAIHPALAEVIARATTKNPMFRVKTARHLLMAVQDAFGQMDAMQVNRAKGESDLAGIVLRTASGSDGGKATPTPEAGATYYDRLSTIAAKRKSGEPGGEETPRPLMEAVEAGTTCVRCKGSLEGQPTTGRCPTCLLLVRYTLDPASFEALQRTPMSRPAAPEPPTARKPEPAPTAEPPRRGFWARLRDRFTP